MKALHRALARAGVLLAGLATVSVALAPSAAAHTTDGYSHDSTTGMTSTDWMSWLHPGNPLSQLSLPGTHDTGAYVWAGDITETQSMDLKEQLNSGIRAWDIRLGYEATSKRLRVYHGETLQGQYFDSDVLATADDFLAGHPGEVIVIRLMHETGPKENFDTRVKAALDKFERVYRGTSNNPLLRDIRGKIVVLPWFSSSQRIGIPWGTLDSQDNWQMTTNRDLAVKWGSVKAQLAASSGGPYGTIYANFLSAAQGDFPYFFASGHSSPQTGAPNLLTGWVSGGPFDTCHLDSRCIPEYPRVGCVAETCSVAFEGVNVMTMNLLRHRQTPGRAGLVYADYPGKGLIQAVIDSNIDFTSGALYGVASGRCVDVPGGTHQNGTPVQLWDCNSGGNQRWQASSTNQLVVYGDKCLDARESGSADGTVVQLYDCNGTGAQKWRYRPDGSIVNIPSGKCLDAYRQGTANGTRLVLWTCNGGANQKWARPQ